MRRPAWRSIEARISHLAYAPEIAAAMLQRQQAGAIIAARAAHRRGRGRHGGDGARPALAEERRRARRGAQGGHGEQPAGRAVRRARARSPSSTRARCTTEDTVAERKAFLLRIDPAVLDALQRWADDELRSLNGQIEFVLRRVAAGRGPAEGPPPASGRPKRQDLTSHRPRRAGADDTLVRMIDAFEPAPRLANGHVMTLWTWARAAQFPGCLRRSTPRLRRRARCARLGPLPLAARTVGPSHAARAARPRRVERGALHARHRGQGVGRAAGTSSGSISATAAAPSSCRAASITRA